MIRKSNRPKQNLSKATKFRDGGAGNKFSRIVKVAKPNENGKIKVKRFDALNLTTVILKLKRGN